MLNVTDLLDLKSRFFESDEDINNNFYGCTFLYFVLSFVVVKFVFLDAPKEELIILGKR